MGETLLDLVKELLENMSDAGVEEVWKDAQTKDKEYYDLPRSTVSLMIEAEWQKRQDLAKEWEKSTH